MDHKKYDVIVVGGGPSGIGAALSASKGGLSVLLLESMGQLGGAGTSAGVSHLLGARSSDNTVWAVKGIFLEIINRLIISGGAFDPVTLPVDPNHYSPHGWTKGPSQCSVGVPVDPFQYAALLDELLEEANVEVLFYSQVVDVKVEAKRITSVTVANKDGIRYYNATVFLDTSGDADLAFHAGAPCVKGIDGTGELTPATLVAHIEDVDEQSVSEYIEKTGDFRFINIVEQLKKKGEWPFPYNRIITVRLPRPGVFMLNTSRLLSVDGTNAASVSKALREGRKETITLLKLLRAHFPGFAKAVVRWIAPALGIRETRRIQGLQTMTVKDLITGKDFNDVIAWSAYGWDLPDPKRPSHQPMDEKKIKKEFTPVSYHSLVPKLIKNLAVAGRCISVERDVLGPLREQAVCVAMGQAIGTAARHVVNSGTNFSDINISRLQNDLRNEGAVIDWPRL